MELIKIENDVAILNEKVSKQIADFEKKAKEIKEKEEELKKAILDAMEKNSLIRIESDDILISYVAPTDRESFDSKKFREEHSDLYDEYINITPVKSSIRIKIKNE